MASYDGEVKVDKRELTKPSLYQTRDTLNMIISVLSFQKVLCESEMNLNATPVVAVIVVVVVEEAAITKHFRLS